MGRLDLKTVQELMGHDTVAMTAGYQHRPDSQVEGAGKLGGPGVSFDTKLATSAKLPRLAGKIFTLQLNALN
jgi:hypothetical protein